MTPQEKYPFLNYDNFSKMSLIELKEVFEGAIKHMKDTPIAYVYDKKQIASFVYLFRVMYQLILAIQKKH